MAKLSPAQNTAPSVETLQGVLRGAGLRSTAPRVAVLRCLTEAKTPLSHGEVAELFASEAFDRATVYRNLMDLTEAGLAVRTDVGDHVWRFELAHKRGRHDDTKHPHFMCRECGDVQCLPEANVKISASPGSLRSFSQKNVEIQIKGVCDRCA